jgi:phosphate transport system permease protein
MSAVSPPLVRRKLGRGWNLEQASQLVGAAIGAIATVWICYDRLLPVSGTLGFWVLSYLAFLAFYSILVAIAEDSVAVRDRLAMVVFSSAGVFLVVALALVVGYTADRGWRAAAHLHFLTQTTASIQPDAPLNQGGVLAAMIGTIEQVGIAIVIAVPLGIATSVYLNEVRGKMSRLVRTVVETMTAIPSILAGLFIFAVVVLTFGFSRCGLAAALALTVQMLPVVARTAEVVLRLVPNGLREASYALGSSQWDTVRKVVLPTARAGLVTAVLLGVARVIGETSPVLLTAGFTAELNSNPTSGPQVSLPLFIFTEVREPLNSAVSRAFGAALVLLIIVLVLFTAARIVGNRAPGPSRRERRRLGALRQLSAQKETS